MFATFLAAILPVLAPVDAVLTDIEGTTTSISFVHDTLFPYAKQHLREYVEAHADEPAVQKIVRQVEDIAHVSNDEVVSTLLSWIDEDKKLTPLKALQGLMWEDGYKQGAFHGHVYDDAFEQLTEWRAREIPLYVYSSGSVKAQQLLYCYSDHGDMTSLFTGNFDTNVGGKRDSASYCVIAEKIQKAPETILFLSDTVEELDAAAQAGMQTVLLCRDGLVPINNSHPWVANFYEINLP